ncbi:putative zinc-binding metallopeptidase [Pedobacter sp. PLR]|uniref:substrate import-associated zinc metallohydrolase lipoprotein n=1 Tax=Pedobacter sp. PLR TaxID=2994465 RepID=UPI0022483339|nr:substrate import-associated zinc metallohydrolase lipoprotein [Pedobacter sp. PLR]MCX2450522.1 putative zinc-binding metallopeptidase [Pedobacter sp. PLR]
MKNIYKTLVVMGLFVAVSSCRKTETLDVDFNKYNLDQPKDDSELGQWLTKTFLDPYNMNVVYRYNRYYYGEPAADVAPLKAENVRPMMQTVLDGFIKPYTKIAGLPFVQKTNPKEWVLYGSPLYQTDGSAIAGTASGGRRITLYGLNNYSTDYGFTKTRMFIIHHEFTHILNQLVAIPVDFEGISEGTYKQPWNSTSAAVAKSNGFLGSYASGSPTEDYAETVATLLVSGQSYYDDYTNTAPNDKAKLRLKQKALNAVNYFNTALNVDFRSLQREIQDYMQNEIKDPTLSFPYWMSKNLYKTMTINLEDPLYTANGVSEDFRVPYEQLKDAILKFNGTVKYHLDNITLRFSSATALTVRLAISPAAGGGQLFADYTFSYTVNPTTGAVVFTKIAQAGTADYYANAAVFATAFGSSIQAYLTGKTFIGAWMPKNINGGSYADFGRLYVKDNPGNYFYGSLGQTL